MVEGCRLGYHAESLLYETWPCPTGTRQDKTWSVSPVACSVTHPADHCLLRDYSSLFSVSSSLVPLPCLTALGASSLCSLAPVCHGVSIWHGKYKLFLSQQVSVDSSLSPALPQASSNTPKAHSPNPAPTDIDSAWSGRGQLPRNSLPYCPQNKQSLFFFLKKSLLY